MAPSFGNNGALRLGAAALVGGLVVYLIWAAAALSSPADPSSPPTTTATTGRSIDGKTEGETPASEHSRPEGEEKPRRKSLDDADPPMEEADEAAVVAMVEQLRSSIASVDEGVFGGDGALADSVADIVALEVVEHLCSIEQQQETGSSDMKAVDFAFEKEITGAQEEEAFELIETAANDRDQSASGGDQKVGLTAQQEEITESQQEVQEGTKTHVTEEHCEEQLPVAASVESGKEAEESQRNTPAMTEEFPGQRQAAERIELALAMAEAASPYKPSLTSTSSAEPLSPSYAAPTPVATPETKKQDHHHIWNKEAPVFTPSWMPQAAPSVNSGSQSSPSLSSPAAQVLSPDQRLKMKSRCRFWPHCTNKACKFTHPTLPCRDPENCTFGDRCNYIHPKDMERQSSRGRKFGGVRGSELRSQSKKMSGSVEWSS